MIVIYSVLLAALLGYSANGFLFPHLKEDPDVHRNAVQLITSKGYDCEVHRVTTDDGYILTMHRIPHGHGKHSPAVKPVVFLQHGLLGCSTNWITNMANESLGFILADAGMDVWLGNFRGDTYSTNHTTLDPKRHEFWEFSWDEMAKYDLPAMLNAALSISGASHLYYVGHSEGTMTAFAQFSQDQVLASKVKHFFALAPVAKVAHVEGLFHYLAEDFGLYEWLLKVVDPNDFMPSNEVTKILSDLICGPATTNPLCADILFIIAGPNSGQLNDSRISVYTSHTPAGTSTQNIIHFAQAVKANTFSMYDYGSAKKNKEKYGQAIPPEYHPETMTVPVSLFSSSIDWLADPTDVVFLEQNLRSIAHNFKYTDFNHLDFIWGLRAANEVYAKIAAIIEKDYHNV